MFLGKDGTDLQRELTEYLKRPEHRALLEEQQREEFCAAQDLQERAVQSAFYAKLSALDVALQRKLRPVVQHDVLRRLLISMSNTPDTPFDVWIQNPRILEMFRKAHRLLRRGRIQEKEIEHFLRQYLASVHPNLQRGPCVALTSQELLAPLNEQLEERTLGNAAYRKGDLDTAKAHYDRALGILDLIRGRHALDQDAIDRCRNDLRLNSAAVYMQKGFHGAAIDICTRVLNQDPKNVKALERRARAYRLRHDPVRARADLKHLVQLIEHS